MEQVVASHPDIPDYRGTLGVLYGVIAEARLGNNQSDDAVEESLNRGIALLTRLNDEFPQRMHYRGLLGRFLHTRAILQNHRGQPRAAKESLERILDLVGSADPSDPEQSMDTMLLAQTYTGLADVLSQIGETALAQQATSKARELWKFAPSAILQRPPSRLRNPWGPDSLPEDTQPDTDIPLKPLPAQSGS